MRSSTHTTAPDQEAGSDGDDNEKDKKRESNTSCYTNHSGCREREGQREGRQEQDGGHFFMSGYT